MRVTQHVADFDLDVEMKRPQYVVRTARPAPSRRWPRNYNKKTNILC